MKYAEKRVFTCKGRCRYSRKRAEICRKFDKISLRGSMTALTLRQGARWADEARPRWPGPHTEKNNNKVIPDGLLKWSSTDTEMVLIQPKEGFFQTQLGNLLTQFDKQRRSPVILVGSRFVAAIRRCRTTCSAELVGSVCHVFFTLAFCEKIVPWV